jgi:hypothetical protein
VTWRGTRIAGTTGTITSATNIVTTNGSETYCEITASGLTSTWTAAGAVGAMVVTSSGAVCFGVKDLGSKRLRITPPYNPTTYSNVTISNEPNDGDKEEPCVPTCVGDEHDRIEDTDERRTERPASRAHRMP